MVLWGVGSAWAAQLAANGGAGHLPAWSLIRAVV